MFIGLLVLTLVYWFYDMLIHFRKGDKMERRKREKEKSSKERNRKVNWLPSHMHPDRGSNPKPGHILTGNKSRTLWYTGWYSIIWTILARTAFFFKVLFLKGNNHNNNVDNSLLPDWCFALLLILWSKIKTVEH